MQLGVWAKPDPCAPYDGNPNNYGKTYGPDSTGDCIKGSGRYTAKHGTNKAAGAYGSGFGDEMWTCFRACTPNCQGQPGMDGGVLPITDAGAGADATVTGDKGVVEAGVVADSATTDGATAGVDGGGADRGDDGCSCAVGRIRGRSFVASLAPMMLLALCILRRRWR